MTSNKLFNCLLELSAVDGFRIPPHYTNPQFISNRWSLVVGLTKVNDNIHKCMPCKGFPNKQNEFGRSINIPAIIIARCENCSLESLVNMAGSPRGGGGGGGRRTIPGAVCVPLVLAFWSDSNNSRLSAPQFTIYLKFRIVVPFSGTSSLFVPVRPSTRPSSYCVLRTSL